MSNEIGALRVAAGLGPPLEHALISLLERPAAGLRSALRRSSTSA